MNLRLTPSERLLLLRALRIAVEDGSIFGGRDDKEAAKLQKKIDAIKAKLSPASTGREL